MTTRRILTVLSFGLLAACAQMSPHEAVQNANTRRVAQKARTPGDHDALSKYFENAAREMQTKADEQKKLLEHYEEKGYLYGRRAQDLKSHTAALLHKYEANVDENIRAAAAHRQMAVEQAKREFATREGRVVNAESHAHSSK